jgi:catechol 2,3-dioxygenase-like lactoylglutathione lyase family enzyme
MPVASVSGIDHVVILARDLDAARGRFARLGFTLSPRGRHSDHIGTANHTIMLREDYVELLGVLRPTEANARWRTALERREGIGTVAFRTRSAAQTASELRALGFPVGAPLHFSRPIEGHGEAAFDVALFPPESTPQLDVFACEHLTPENVWRPALMEHANGAVALASVTVVTEDPAAVQDAYERLLGPGRVRRSEDALVVDTGSAPIRFMRRDALAARYRGIPLAEAAPPHPAVLGVRVRDLAETRRALAGIETVEREGALLVPPAAACGVLLEFVA